VSASGSKVRGATPKEEEEAAAAFVAAAAGVLALAPALPPPRDERADVAAAAAAVPLDVSAPAAHRPHLRSAEDAEPPEKDAEPAPARAAAGGGPVGEVKEGSRADAVARRGRGFCCGGGGGAVGVSSAVGEGVGDGGAEVGARGRYASTSASAASAAALGGGGAAPGCSGAFSIVARRAGQRELPCLPRSLN
jgi:hypothetical protein